MRNWYVLTRAAFRCAEKFGAINYYQTIDLVMHTFVVCVIDSNARFAFSSLFFLQFCTVLLQYRASSCATVLNLWDFEREGVERQIKREKETSIEIERTRNGLKSKYANFVPYIFLILKPASRCQFPFIRSIVQNDVVPIKLL